MQEELDKTNSAGADFVSDLPADNLYCAPSLARGLRVVLERRNRQFGQAVVGVDVAFAARRLARLWASAAATTEAEHVSCVEILEVRAGRPETVKRVARSHDAQGVLRTAKHYGTIAMVTYLCKADYALHTEKIWEGTTLRKGCLTSQDLSRQGVVYDGCGLFGVRCGARQS